MKSLAISIALLVVASSAPAMSARTAGERPSENVVVADVARAPGKLGLVGHDPLLFRGMNAALAIHKGHAYVGSRTDGLHPNAGVMVVDVRDPKAPEVVGQIGPPNEGNIGETSREMRVWPEQDLLIVLNLASNCSFIIHACSPTQLVGDDNYRFYDISDPASPELVAEYRPSLNPHEFFLWTDPKDRDRALLYQSTPAAGTKVLITDISGVAKGRFDEVATFETIIPNPETDNRLHSMSITPDGDRMHIAALGGGYLEADTSQVAAGKRKPKIRLITNMAKHPSWGDPGAHSTVPFFGRDYVLATDEVYGYIPGLLPDHGCPWGWVRIIDIRNHIAPKVISQFKLPENTKEFCDSPADNDPIRNSTASYSAHNPTLTPNVALITWHSGGLQALDLSDPAKPRQLAEFRPDPLPAVTQEDPALSSGRDKVVMWSFPIIYKGLIYVVDVRNGLYILDYKGPHAKEISSVDFLEGNSNLGDSLRYGRR